MAQMPFRVAFLGLGAMGSRMALRLARAGYSVTAWNRTPRDFSALRQAGVTLGAEIAPLVTAADVVALCVLDDAATQDVLCQGFGAMRPGSAVINFSTISVETSKAMAHKALSQGIAYLDAPVSGGAGAAADGTLAIMVGGAQEAFERCATLFGVLGERVVHMGPSGSGAATKLVTQMLAAINQVAITEAVATAAAAGIDMPRLFELWQKSFAASRALDRMMPLILAHAEDATLPLSLYIKDLRLASAFAEASGRDAPLTKGTLLRLTSAERAGLGDRDPIALMETLTKTPGD